MHDVPRRPGAVSAAGLRERLELQPVARARDRGGGPAEVGRADVDAGAVRRRRPSGGNARRSARRSSPRRPGIDASSCCASCRVRVRAHERVARQPVHRRERRGCCPRDATSRSRRCPALPVSSRSRSSRRSCASAAPCFFASAASFALVLRLREPDDLLARQHRDVELVAERRRETLELRQELLADARASARSRGRCSRRRTRPRSRERSSPRRRREPGPLAPALAHPAVTIAAAAATAAAGTIKRDMSLLCRLSPHQPGHQTGEALP